MAENHIVKGTIARKELGKPGPAIGRTRFAALKRKLGFKGHYVNVFQMRQYLAENPNFSELEVYPRTRKSRPSIPSGPRVSNGHTNGERLLTHG